MAKKTLDVDIPKLYKPLIAQQWRFKVCASGRGTAKSWSMAIILIIMAYSKILRILCTREIMKSISDSVHLLLRDTIYRLGLQDSFEVTAREIRCTRTGSQFLFEGLRHNVSKIKSLEGIDICWNEESNNLTQDSLDLLIPTIRKEGSELWFSFNPTYELDPVYQKFVVNTPENCLLIQGDYNDNPYFPDVLREEMEQDKATDFQKYEHIWLGKPKGGGDKYWTSFDKKIHVKKVDINQSLVDLSQAFMAIDPSSKYYAFALWGLKVPVGTGKYEYIIYNEYPTLNHISQPFAKIRHSRQYLGTIKDLEASLYAQDGHEWGIEVQTRYVDSRYAVGTGGGNYNLGTTNTLVQEFAKPENGGMVLEMPYVKAIDEQRTIIQGLMSYNKVAPISPINMPLITIMPHCTNLIESLQNHKYIGDTIKQDEYYKDASDTLRILFAGMAQSRPKKVKKVIRSRPRRRGSWMG